MKRLNGEVYTSTFDHYHPVSDHYELCNAANILYKD